MLSLTYKFYFCEQEVDLTFKARSRAFAHEFLYLVGRGTLTAGILWYLHVETIYQEVPAKKKAILLHLTRASMVCLFVLVACTVCFRESAS